VADQLRLRQIGFRLLTKAIDTATAPGRLCIFTIDRYFVFDVPLSLDIVVFA
jgi:hypothetical protein